MTERDFDMELEEFFSDLPEPTRSECRRLVAAAIDVKSGKLAEAVIKLQAFMANWRVDHPDLPLVPRSDFRNVEDNRPPTDKQKEYALKVSIYTGVRLPAKFTRSEVSKFLDENAPKFYKILADAREQGENAEPLISEEEAVMDLKSGASCSVSSGSSGCKRCQERRKEYVENHKDDAEVQYADEMPF